MTRPRASEVIAAARFAQQDEPARPTLRPCLTMISPRRYRRRWTTLSAIVWACSDGQHRVSAGHTPDQTGDLRARRWGHPQRFGFTLAGARPGASRHPLRPGTIGNRCFNRTACAHRPMRDSDSNRCVASLNSEPTRHLKRRSRPPLPVPVNPPARTPRDQQLSSTPKPRHPRLRPGWRTPPSSTPPRANLLKPDAGHRHGPGGRPMTTTEVDNWPVARDGRMGPRADGERFQKHAERASTPSSSADHINQVDFSQRPSHAHGRQWQPAQPATTPIIATGASALVPGPAPPSRPSARAAASWLARTCGRLLSTVGDEVRVASARRRATPPVEAEAHLVCRTSPARST